MQRREQIIPQCKFFSSIIIFAALQILVWGSKDIACSCHRQQFQLAYVLVSFRHIVLPGPSAECVSTLYYSFYLPHRFLSSCLLICSGRNVSCSDSVLGSNCCNFSFLKSGLSICLFISGDYETQNLILVLKKLYQFKDLDFSW